MIIQAINNGSIVFKAYGEQPSVDIPMLLVVEGSYTSVTPVITVDDTLSLVSENPVQNKVLTAALNDKADAADLNALNAKCASSEISDNLLSFGGITFGTGYSGAIRSDGSVIVSTDGTQSGSGTIVIDITNTLPAGTYKLSGCAGGNNDTYYMALYEKGDALLTTNKDGFDNTFTVNAPTQLSLAIVATGGTKITDKLFYPMVSDASIVSPTFSKATVDDGFQRIGGHDRVDVVLGNKAHYLIRYTVISRSTPGQVIKTGYYWIATSSGDNSSTSITDTTNGPEGSPNFTLYDDSEGAKCIRVTDRYNNRDIMLEVMGY